MKASPAVIGLVILDEYAKARISLTNKTPMGVLLGILREGPANRYLDVGRNRWSSTTR